MAKGKRTKAVTAADVLPKEEGKEKKELTVYKVPHLAFGRLEKFEPKDMDLPVNLPLPEVMKSWRQVLPDFPSTFHFEEAGDYLIGTLIDVKTAGQLNSTVYIIEVGIGAEATRVSVWGRTALDSKMLGVKKGMQVGIILLGMKPAKKAGHQDWYDFRVFTP